VVQLVPEADVVTLVSERADRFVRETGLQVDDLAGRVQARAVDRLLGGEALVQDSREDLREGGPKPRASGGAGGEHEPAVVEGDRRGHHALHPLPGLERPDQQVGLAEHAVQVEVVAREEVAGAQTEAGRDHTGAAGGVGDTQIRRVLVGTTAEERRRENAGEGKGTVGGSCAAKWGQGNERVHELREAGAGLHAHPRVQGLGRLKPFDAVRGQVLGRHEPVAGLHQLEQRVAQRPVVERARALGGHDLERGHEARLVEPVACLEQHATGRIDAAALAHRHHRRKHCQALRVRGRHGNAAPSDPERGLDQARPGKRPGPSPKGVEARRDAGHGAGGRPDEVVHELLAEGDGQLRQCGRLATVSEPRDGDEEVEHLRAVASRLQPDRIAAPRDARHHGFRDARCERGSDRRVGRRTAVLEDLEAGLGRRRMACSNAGRDPHLC
jgi:hypothetical protein